MPDLLIDRMAWALRTYKNAALQGRTVPSDVLATAEAALAEYDRGRRQDEEDAPNVADRLGAHGGNPR